MDRESRERRGTNRPPRAREASGRAGYTVLEVSVVTAIAGVVLGLAVWGFSGYATRSAAQHAAQVFAQDLKVARSEALLGQRPVVVRFREDQGWYEVATGSPETVLLRRDFLLNTDVRLEGIDLRLEGDSLVVDRRGMIHLAGSGGALGEALFKLGTTRYVVRFNASGTAKVEEY